MLSEYANEHVGNIPVTFVTQKRFAILFFLTPCCVNAARKDKLFEVSFF